MNKLIMELRVNFVALIRDQLALGILLPRWLQYLRFLSVCLQDCTAVHI